MHRFADPTPEQRRARLKWAKALESGKFGRTKGYLCKTKANGETGYCCLGVAADVIVPGTWHASLIDEHIGQQYLPPESEIPEGKEIVWKFKPEHVDFGRVDDSFLDGTSRELLGITNDEQMALANANDKGRPFSVIAGWIRAGHIPQRYM